MTTRRRWISLAGLSAISAAAYPVVIESRWLDLTHTPIQIGLKSPIRILHLADFHASFFVPMSLIEHAIQVGLQQKPDIVCITGDFITFQTDFHLERYVRSLKQLSDSAPAYAVLGNHDGGKWASAHGGFSDHKLVDQMLASSRVRLLRNCAETIRVNGCSLSVVGVGDLWSEEIDAQAAFATVDRSAHTLLLSHNPDSKETLKDHRWDVMLSGHTHGGQVIVPFWGPCYAPVKDKAFVAGLRAWQDRQIFVTRGVGNLGGVRFRCRPEVSVLTLL